MNSNSNHTKGAPDVVRRFTLVEKLKHAGFPHRRKSKRRASELNAISQSLEMAVLSISLSGKVLSWNSGAEKLYGYRAKEILNESVFCLIPLGHGHELQEKLKLASNGLYSQGIETVHLKKDGKLFPVFLAIFPVSDGEGHPVSAAWVSYDISEKVAAEERNKLFSRIVEQTSDGVLLTDRSGVIAYANRGFEAMTGYSTDEVVGKTPRLLKSGVHSPEFYRDLWETILSGRPFRGTLVSKRKNGELLVTEKTIAPLCDAQGSVTHFVSTDKDITERKQSEEKYRKLLRQYEDLFNYSSDAIAYCNLEGRFMSVNGAFSLLTGFSTKELLSGKKYQDITTSGYWNLGNQKLQEILETKKAISYEKEYVHKDGYTIPSIVTAFPLMSDTDKDHVMAIGVIVKDISERKSQEERLKRVAQRLKISNEALEQFASLASHDLQEPLRTINLHLTRLRKSASSKLDKEEAEALEFVASASSRLRNLVSALLEFSQIGREEVRRERFESKNVLERALKNLSASIQVSHAKINYSQLPALYGSEESVLSVFQNLISNALKYCEKGVEPTVEISATDEGDFWKFCVRDNGIGIERENTEKVFKMFSRLHSSQQYPGTGIGLAACRKVIESNGGKIWVESEIGKGSDFFWTWPKG